MKRAVEVLILMMAISISSLAQEKGSTCQITISTPQPGNKVGKEGRIRGTAKVPAGTYLWVLSHMKDLTADWWPQGKHAATINPDSSEWVIIAGYGRAEDVNQDFEIAVAVVDEGTNRMLLDWFKDAKEKDFPAIGFPTTVDGCAPIKVTVKKTSH